VAEEVFDGVHLAAIGLVIGLALASATANAIAAWLFGINPLEVQAFAAMSAVFAAMSAVFAAIVLVASYLPARGAASRDPLTALRDN
jgi:putative ABC transport system permease protein